MYIWTHNVQCLIIEMPFRSHFFDNIQTVVLAAVFPPSKEYKGETQSMEHSSALGNLILAEITLYCKGPGCAREICSRYPTVVVNTLIRTLFTLSQLIRAMFHAQGDRELSDTLRAEYFKKSRGVRRDV
jgi:hypothetical protein